MYVAIEKKMVERGLVNTILFIVADEQETTILEMWRNLKLFCPTYNKLSKRINILKNYKLIIKQWESILRFKGECEKRNVFVERGRKLSADCLENN